jgi:NADH dehydrogenase
VAIIGGGFGGLSAAKALARAPVDVTVIDRTNHYLFQPLLYQVATGLLSPADIAVPIRFLLRRQRNATVVLATVDGIDVARHVVSADGQLIPYDFLIVSTGSRHSYFGHPEWEGAAPGLKTLEDAREIRRRFLVAFEEAEKSGDPAVERALMTFVVVGGGPTGVELAGVLTTIARKGIRREFRHIDAANTRVVLVEAGPRVLPMFPEPLSEHARKDLEALGVEVRTDTRVTGIDAGGVDVGGERIESRTVFWAAGNQTSPLIRSLGVPLDRAGRAIVAPDLSIPDHPEVFVIGDAAAAALDRTGALVPGLAAAAIQMGAHAARMIARTLDGFRAREPFRYHDKGALAVIGRNRAIANFGWIRLTGRFAFLTWLFVHIAYLAGFRNRVSVMLEWAYAYFTNRPGARLISEAEVERRGTSLATSLRDETPSTRQ